MQSASQTTKSPETAKKALGPLAVLAVGVDAAASFLKSKMEKAAAVASQVGAAVLNSKKAVSAAAAAVLVGLLPKQFKKTRLVVSASILAGIFAAQNQGMAIPRGTWLPKYEMTQKYRNVTHYAIQTYWWKTEIEFSSEYLIPNSPGSLVNARAVAVEETHKAGRYNAWQKKTTYLTWRGIRLQNTSLIETRKEFGSGTQLVVILF